MTIQNPKAFCDGLWDWACLDGCFGETHIKPTDIDGEVERNGRFLVFETKQAGVSIPYGQEIMFQRKIDTGLFTVVVIWGNPGKPERIKLMTSKATIFYENASLDRLRWITERWFDWAENQTPAPRFSEW